MPRSRSPLLLPLLTLLGVLTLHGAAWGQAFGWAEGDARNPGPGVLLPEIHSAPWFQTWDLWLWTQDERVVVAQFVTSSAIRRLALKGSARVAIADLRQPGSRALEQVRRGDRGYDGDRGDWAGSENPIRVNFHQSEVRWQGETLHFAMHTRGVTMEVALTPQAPWWWPGHGRLRLREDPSRFAQVLFLPRARFTGTLRMEEGGDTTPISGVALFASTLTNAMPAALGHTWHRFVTMRADGMTLLAGSALVPVDDGFAAQPYVAAFLDGREVFSSTQATLTLGPAQRDRRGSGTYDIPRQLLFSARRGQDELQIVVDVGRMVLAEDLLSKLSPLVRGLLARAMAPMDYEHEATYSARLTIDGHVANIAGAGWLTSNYAR